MFNFYDFFQLCNAHPWAYIAILVNFVVVFVNGYTDGPGTIATAVSTRAMKPRPAFLMCAICNALGCLTIGAFSSAISQFAGGDVSKTIAGLVNWGSASADAVLCAIACGMASIIIVSQICTWLSLPSSQSNCLVGGITGVGIGLMVLNYGGSIMLEPWIKVAIGFFGSLIVGFILGYLATVLIQKICKNMNKGKTNRFFDKGQIVSSAIMSYVHGIQDGAKFIGIFILIAAILFSTQSAETLDTLVSNGAGIWWIYVPISVILFVGSMLGGTKILKTLGKGIASLKRYQAFGTDIAASIGLIAATFLGLPLSTGTIKNTAIMGSGAARSIRRVKWKKAGEVILWGFLVFPASILCGFLLILIFVWTCK